MPGRDQTDLKDAVSHVLPGELAILIRKPAVAVRKSAGLVHGHNGQGGALPSVGAPRRFCPVPWSVARRRVAVCPAWEQHRARGMPWEDRRAGGRRSPRHTCYEVRCASSQDYTRVGYPGATNDAGHGRRDCFRCSSATMTDSFIPGYHGALRSGPSYLSTRNRAFQCGYHHRIGFAPAARDST